MATTGQPPPQLSAALLRGINVGGRNQIRMADLRRVLGEHGFTDVATYINSGNIVFRHPAARTEQVAGEIERLIADHLEVTCRALVLRGGQVSAIAAAVPAGWENGPAMKADVVYLLDGADPHELAGALNPREGIDSVVIAPGALLWMVQRSDASRSGLRNLVGSAWYARTTVRNVNTARRLAQLVAERGPVQESD